MNLLALPDDVLVLIVGMLPPWDYLVVAPLVCHRFRQACLHSEAVSLQCGYNLLTNDEVKETIATARLRASAFGNKPTDIGAVTVGPKLLCRVKARYSLGVLSASTSTVVGRHAVIALLFTDALILVPRQELFHLGKVPTMLHLIPSDPRLSVVCTAESVANLSILSCQNTISLSTYQLSDFQLLKKALHDLKTFQWKAAALRRSVCPECKRYLTTVDGKTKHTLFSESTPCSSCSCMLCRYCLAQSEHKSPVTCSYCNKLNAIVCK